jgi:hypothetical protein
VGDLAVNLGRRQETLAQRGLLRECQVSGSQIENQKS